LRVRIQAEDVVTGSSTIPKPAAEDAPIESLILQARNTIFSTELWQELNRESRTLGAFDVKAKGDTLIVPFSENKTIVLDLVPLGDSASPPPGSDDTIAEGLYLSLNLLLSYAHRQNHRLRTRIPPPISGTKRPNPPYTLLRALITRFNHQKTITSLHQLLGPLCAVLKSASLSPSPTYTITHSASQPPLYANPSLAERTIFALTDRLESTATLSLTPDTTLTIISRTQQFPIAGTAFSLTLNPESELNTTCIPPSGLASIEDFEGYLFFATSCALASLYTSPDTEDSGWVRTMQPNVLRKLYTGGKAKQLVFDVSRIKTGNKGVKGNCMLTVAWEWMRHDVWSVGTEQKHDEAAAFGDKRKEQGTYEWRHVATWNNEEGEGEVVKPLDNVVKDAENDGGIDGMRQRLDAGKDHMYRGK
jgi:mediator of RNA polymerase II transcription subunit 17